MRKMSIMMLVFVLILSIIAGCSSQSTSGGEVTLNALFMKQAGYSEDDVKAITDEFTKANPNIKVNLTFAPYEALEQKIQTSASSGGFDVVVIDAPWTPKFAVAGFVKDVTDKLSDDAREDIFAGAIDSVSYNGKLYGMPWLNDTKFLFYNKQMLAEAGYTEAPKTWEELLTQAKAIKDKGIAEYPIVWSWAQAEALICDYTTLTATFGGQMIDNGNPTINDDANLDALNFMVQTIKEGITDPKSTEYLEEDVRGVFSSGKAAFALNWTYMYNLANDKNESQVAGNVGIAPIPGTDSAGSASVNGGMGLAVTSGSKHVDEAWKYIEYMSSKEVQIKYAQNALPIWKSLYDDQQVIDTNPAVVEVSKFQYDHLVNRPQVPWYGQLSTELQVGIQEALLDKKSAEAALNEIQQKAEGLVK